MRVNAGQGWVDMGPASSMGGLTGHHSSMSIALSEAVSPSHSMTGSVSLRCGICSVPTSAGRLYCNPAHAKLGWGDRRG